MCVSAELTAPMATASARTLRLLIPLVLERAGIAEAYHALTGDSSTDALREGAVVDRIICDAKGSELLLCRLDAIFADHLARDAMPFAGLPMMELAEAWAHIRLCPQGSTCAALLWSVARSRDVFFRVLEERITEELEVRAARALAAKHRTQQVAKTHLSSLERRVG